MVMDYPEEPEDTGPDEVVAHRWEVAERIIQQLGIQESESKPNAIGHGLVEIQETYEGAIFEYVDELYSNASKELKKVKEHARRMRISLALLGDGARWALNSNRRSQEEMLAWEKAGGDNLPQVIGPAPEESRFNLKIDHEDIWKEGGSESYFGIFGPRGYRPSPIELQLKRLEEWIETKIKNLRNTGKERKPKRMGDVLFGMSPRNKMIQDCAILLGTNGQDLSSKLLPLIRLIEAEFVNPDGDKEWSGAEAAMRARWWWEEVGPYFGKPINEVPEAIRAKIGKGWTSQPRYKKPR